MTNRLARSPMLTSVSTVFIASLITVCLFIRKIIFISQKKQLFDEPLELRKIHINRIPNLAGIGIYGTVLLVSSVFVLFKVLPPSAGFVLAASLVLFGIGVTDDLVGVKPNKKMSAQLVSAIMVTVLADIRFKSFYGVLGFGEMPYYLSIFVSVIFILLVINAFNLIDGINWLSGAISLICVSIFGYLFFRQHQDGIALFCFSVSGTLVGFLYYNKTPAKIFMGDTGSLFLGFVAAVLSILFLESNRLGMLSPEVDFTFSSAPAIILSLLIIPLFDTVRIFSIRMLEGRSPFAADRNHIHHRLLDLKLSHMQATFTLVTVNLTIFLITILLRHLSNETLFAVITTIMLALNALVGYLLARKPLLAANDGFSKIKLKPAFYVIEDNLENLRWQNYLADDFVLENEPQDLTEVNSYLLSLSKEEETKENISLT